MNIYESLTVPGPTETALSQPFWAAAEEGRLRIQRCDGCGQWVFYPRPLCPHCWSDKLEWRDASGSAVIASYSEIFKPGHPGWVPAAPYFVALVRLDEGPTMLSHILDASRSLSVGDAVQFSPTRVGSRVLPFFIRVDSSGG